MIDAYSFGKIIIRGKEYQKDLMILEENIYQNWHRKSGHSLELDDIKEILKFDPEIIIVGTGTLGMMLVKSEVKEYCRVNQIDLHVLTTDEAIKVFNALLNHKKIAGLFHLTC